jgi:hypothetical protein
VTAGGKSVEARQPLASRKTNGQTRPVAPVPRRGKARGTVDHPIALKIEDVSEIDVDAHSHAPPQLKVEVEVPIQMRIGPDDKSSVDEESDAYEEEGEKEEAEDDDWLRMTNEEMISAEQEMQLVRSRFHDEIDMFDTTMVEEYADDIFKHMEELELTAMPNPRYMESQTEIEW